jgi:hypothetical protein
VKASIATRGSMRAFLIAAVSLLILPAGAANAAAASCDGLPATLVGTPGSDLLVGTSRRDVIQGLGGHDVIRGLGRSDRICGVPAATASTRAQALTRSSEELARTSFTEARTTTRSEPVGAQMSCSPEPEMTRSSGRAGAQTSTTWAQDPTMPTTRSDMTSTTGAPEANTSPLASTGP